MATIKEVFQMIRTGCNAAEILNGLQIPPSRLWEIMDSRRMVKLLALQERVTQVGMRLTATTNGLKAAGRLAGMAEGHIPELARRACVHLLDQVRATEQQGPGTGDQGSGKDRNKQGSGEKEQQKQQKRLRETVAPPTQGRGVERHVPRCDNGGGGIVSVDNVSCSGDMSMSSGRLETFGNVELCSETLRNVEELGGTLRVVEKRLDVGGSEGDVGPENGVRE